MPDPTPQDRLQPALLDRLTDEEPGEAVESREKRVLSASKLREAVLRDLAWLLNTDSIANSLDLEEYPEVARSVVNYGVPTLTGLTSSGLDASGLAEMLRQAIVDFEPRIMPETVHVRAITDPSQMGRNSLAFEIEGELWAKPLSERLFLKTEVDLETGQYVVGRSDKR